MFAERDKGFKAAFTAGQGNPDRRTKRGQRGGGRGERVEGRRKKGSEEERRTTEEKN